MIVEHEIKKLKFKSIKFAPYNPRVFSADDKYKLDNSLNEFGYVNLLTVNKRTMHVVGGNQRLKILKESNLQEGNVIMVDLDLEHEKMLNLALNKIGGEFDNLKLREIFNDLGKNPEFDLSLSGFHFPEIERIQGLGELKIIQPPQSDFAKEADEQLSTKTTDISIHKEEIPTGFKSYDDNIKTEHLCPKCGYAWS